MNEEAREWSEGERKEIEMKQAGRKKLDSFSEVSLTLKLTTS